jgi:nicotinamide-nucleotide adenylyltransferase
LTTGLFLGRFQPVHNGHILSIKNILDEVDDLVIVVGSALKSFSLENPFTAGERIHMIRLALAGAEIPLDRVLVLAVPDTLPPNYHGIYVSQVETYCPKFDVVYTHNPLVRTLFEQAGHKLGSHEVYERTRYWGTTIRDKMLNGGEWRNCVPESVAGYIDEIDGVRRLKQLSGSDEPEQ